MMQEGKRGKLKEGVVAHGLGRRRVVELRNPARTETRRSSKLIHEKRCEIKGGSPWTD